ncbi:alanyl-tRNA editing protein [Paraburkholderia sp. C35]|uniref:alanyl-tRNA editing protein n=1 Tax=Paraburkholderia sp. C35 TaxID=2126993 RepID=UPI000D68B6B9|nr:alanyl-tRNA editing protein [Paraburkholderia sp. C35]
MTKKLYLSDSLNLEGITTITEVIPDSPLGHVVRLTSTLFHPQGGGQKADRGTLGSRNVLHVAHDGTQVNHVVDTIDGLIPGQEIEMKVDAAWRYLNAAYHTSGHLLSCVVAKLYPALRALAGHQWPGEARVEFTGDVPAGDISIDAINAALAEEIATAHPVMIVGDPFNDRAIQIRHHDAIPCGGVHLQTLAALSKVEVLAVRNRGTRLRISYNVVTRA